MILGEMNWPDIRDMDKERLVAVSRSLPSSSTGITCRCSPIRFSSMPWWKA